jgi:hypothetical protein
LTALRVYLAGASREVERAQYWSKAIRSCSELALVSTWHQTAKSWAGTDHTYPLQDQRNIAAVDLGEVSAADCLWLRVPHAPSIGAFVELGFSLAHRKRVIVSGPGCDSSIFTALANFRSPDDSLAFAELLRLAASQTQPVPVPAQASVRPGAM